LLTACGYPFGWGADRQDARQHVYEMQGLKCNEPTIAQKLVG